MDAPEPDRSRAVWRTSSYSNNGGACVEVAGNLPGTVAVRDSKDRDGPVLVLTPAQWREFTAGIRAGELSPG
jgi:Domain of unknown function (DUF397)